jgi:hypothetical protein
MHVTKQRLTKTADPAAVIIQRWAKNGYWLDVSQGECL